MTVNRLRMIYRSKEYQTITVLDFEFIEKLDLFYFDTQSTTL